MTDIQSAIAKLREAGEGLSIGPWKPVKQTIQAQFYWHVFYGDESNSIPCETAKNAAFIALSRNVFDEMLAVVNETANLIWDYDHLERTEDIIEAVATTREALAALARKVGSNE